MIRSASKRAKLRSRGGDRRRRVGAVGGTGACGVSSKHAPARVFRNVPSWSRTGTPRRLCPRARTPTRPPRGPPRCGPWTPQLRSQRARDPSRRLRVPVERRGATPRKIRPAAPTPRRTKCARSRQVCQEARTKKERRKRRRRVDLGFSGCSSRSGGARATSGFPFTFRRKNCFQKWKRGSRVRQKCSTNLCFFQTTCMISNRDRRKKICIAYAAAPLPKTSRTREASVRPSSSRRGRARDAPRFRHTRTDGTRFRSGRAGARRAAVSARPTQPVPECETIENREIANR